MSDTIPERPLDQNFIEYHQSLGSVFVAKYLSEWVTEENPAVYAYDPVEQPEMEKQMNFGAVVVNISPELSVVGIYTKDSITDNYAAAMMYLEMRLVNRLQKQGRRVIVLSDFTDSKVGGIGDGGLQALRKVNGLMSSGTVIRQIVRMKANWSQKLIEVLMKLAGGNLSKIDFIKDNEPDSKVSETIKRFLEA
ncbi:MAG: hypothetical protein ABI721_00500 [Candidatus Dojkabacteria bacterium]